MKNTFKTLRFSIVAIVAAASIALVGCSDSNSNKDVLKVGMSADYPPFEFYQNAEIVGLDVDLINKIAERMGKKVRIQSLSFDNLIGALENKRIDLAISSITATEDRERRLDFSMPYYHNSFSIVYRNGQPIKTESDLQGKKIGAQTGSIMDKFLKKMNHVRIFSLNNNAIMIEELKLGRLDGVLVETAQAIEFVRSNLSLRYQKLADLENNGYSIAFPKGSKLRDRS